MDGLDQADLLSSYPRRRPGLSPAHARLYEQEYRLNRDGGALVVSLARRLEGWMHRQVAARAEVAAGAGPGDVLELGAGTLNHLAWEPPAARARYDIVEPFEALYRSSPLLGTIRDVYARLADVPPERRYDRIVSVAVLEHLTDLPAEMARAAMTLKPGGVLQAGIPSEGGLLWWLGWRCTTGISYWRRTRLDYGPVMRHEHVNTAPEILGVLGHIFADVRVRRFPLPLHLLSFYAYIEARAPDPARCAAILSAR